MSSSSDFATGPAAPVTADSVSSDDAAETAADIGAPEEVETVESDSVKVDGSLADLHRETAAMLRTLAGRYDAEAADKRALAARLRAESDANESLASQLAEESARIRVDADRLGTEPTWIGSVAGGDAASAPSTEEAPHDSSDDGSPTGDVASNVGSPSAWSSPSAETTHSEEAAGSDQPAQSFSGVEPAPGPGPARGFAPSPEPGGETATTAESGSSSAEPPGAPEDWAPRPFESWRNQTSRVIPRLLGL